MSILRDRSYKDGNDEDHERDDDDDGDDNEKISALYGKDGRGATLEELMDRKHFREIPEFRLSVKKIFLCDTVSDSVMLVHFREDCVLLGKNILVKKTF